MASRVRLRFLKVWSDFVSSVTKIVTFWKSSWWYYRRLSKFLARFILTKSRNSSNTEKSILVAPQHCPGRKTIGVVLRSSHYTLPTGSFKTTAQRLSFLTPNTSFIQLFAHLSPTFTPRVKNLGKRNSSFSFEYKGT